LVFLSLQVTLLHLQPSTTWHHADIRLDCTAKNPARCWTTWLDIPKERKTLLLKYDHISIINCNSIDLSNWLTYCTNSCFILRLLYSSTCFEHYVVKIVLYSIWYHHTCRWPSLAQIERGLSPFSTCAREGHLSQPVHGTATYRCDDTRCCRIQFWPAVDKHVVLETCREI
jgi:hypothetical protein